MYVYRRSANDVAPAQQAPWVQVQRITRAESGNDQLNGYGVEVDGSQIIYGARDAAHSVIARLKEDDLVSGPVLNVSASGASILDGASTTSLANGTQFNPLLINRQSQMRTFTIASIGLVDSTLTGSPLVRIAGPAASDFRIVNQPNLNTIASGTWQTFMVEFEPTSSGTRSARIEIAHNGGDALYQFAISGVGLDLPISTMAVFGGANGDIPVPHNPDDDFNLPDGSGAEFGRILPGVVIERSFFIRNLGNSPMTLTGPIIIARFDGPTWNPANLFSIIAAPGNGTIIPAGGSETVTIRFAPTALTNTSEGHDARISIPHNDNDADTSTPYQFIVSGFVEDSPTPAIQVRGLGQTISQNDTTPSTVDGSQFGDILVSSGSVVRTFTIHNVGTATLNLLGSPAVVIDGSNQFVVTQPAQSAIPVGGQTSFTVTCDPSVSGLHEGIIRITSDNYYGGSPYNFSVAANGTLGAATAPVLVVRGGTIAIPAGDVTPRASDGTDFGSVVVGGTLNKEFVLANIGDAVLSVTGTTITGANADQFSVLLQADSTITPGPTTSKIRVQFHPNSVGTKHATITINSSDPVTATYAFAILGIGTETEQSVNPFLTLSGSGSLNGVVGTGISTYVVSMVASTGAPLVTYSIAPSLPSCLSLQVTTGEISGTPTVPWPETEHLIMATAPGYDSGSNVVRVTVINGVVNTNPVATIPSTTTVLEDDSVIINVSASDVDVGQTLTWTSTVPAHGTVSGLGTGTSRQLTYQPDDHYAGSDAFTVTVSDGNGGSVSVVVNVTVTPVNDAPVFVDGGNVTVNEDSGLFSMTGWATGINPGPNESSQTMTFSVANNNSSLFSVAPAVSSTGTLTFTTLPQAFGVATVTVTGMDNGGTTNGGANQSVPRQFTITVNPVNDAPTISPITSQATLVNQPTGAIALTISDQETSPTSLTLSASSSQLALVPISGVAFAGTGSDRTVVITPVSGQSGTSVMTITVSDGALTAQSTFVLTVSALANTAPSATVPGSITVQEDSSVDFLVIASDSDVGQTLTWTASVPSHGVITGLGMGVNRTLTYTPTSNYSGPDSFTVTVDDGQGGSVMRTVTVTVNPVNDAPTISSIIDQTIQSGSASAMLAFTVDDLETLPAVLIVTVSTSNPTLIPLSNIVLGGSDSARHVGVTSLAGQTGTSAITLSVSDGILSVTSRFVVTVTSEAPPAAPSQGPMVSNPSSTTPTLSGQRNPGQIVHVYLDGVEIGTVSGSGSTWTFTPTAPLTQGSHTLWFTVSQGSGPQSPASPSVVIVVDTIAPATPSVPVVGGTERVPVLTGSGELGATVRVWVDGVMSATAAVTGTGSWTVTLSGLTVGSHAVQVDAIDTALNASARTTAINVVITSAPTPGKGGSGGGGCGAGSALALTGLGMLLAMRRRRWFAARST